jgi:hypothetical protein
MDGYHEDPDQTASTRRPGGWHGTSDVGRMDEDGFVSIIDPLRDMIITGGFNVWPSGISGREVGRGGHGDRGAARGSAGRRGAGHLGLPRRAGRREDAEGRLLPRAPRSPVGKVLGRALRDEYWTEAGRSV